MKSLGLYKISPSLINSLQHNKKLRNINLILSHPNGIMRSDNQDINCGVFQGDPLSSLLLCIALITLFTALSRTNYGYKTKGKTISHLLYKEYLKLYGKNVEECLNSIQYR